MGMKKKYIQILILLCALCFVFYYAKNKEEAIVLISGPDVTSQFFPEKIVNKIWVEENWDGNLYSYPSFRITHIGNGEIEGRFVTGWLARPDSIFDTQQSWGYLGKLWGTVHDNIAECHFNEESGNEGTLRMDFLENGMVEVSIKYTSRNSAMEEKFRDGIFCFRPYNLRDDLLIIKEEEKTFQAELEIWGNVYLKAECRDTGKAQYPWLYMTDTEGNILYEFNAPYLTGTKIGNIVVEDMDADGLKDIYVITYFEGDEVAQEWCFYQLEDRTFKGTSKE